MPRADENAHRGVAAELGRLERSFREIYWRFAVLAPADAALARSAVTSSCAAGEFFQFS
jgi:hypothetical protein